jgi:hypothetical protein
MSDQENREESAGEEALPSESGPELDADETDKMRDLLRGAMREEGGAPSERQFLRGVQKRLRDRSGGKFYADEWSTARRPTYTYLWTSVVMLVIVLLVYAVMTSLSGEAVEIENTPAPVQIVFPKSR